MAVRIKTVFAIAIALVVMLTTGLISACGQDADDKGITAGAVEVVDGEGSTITLDKPVSRIIVLAPSALEIIDGLGAMDMVIEVDNFTVMAGEPLAAGFEGVGDSQSLNVEKIAELDPDILITITGGPEEDYNKVAELGIPVYRKTESMGIEGVYEEISNISKLVGLEEEGELMVSDLKTSVEEIYSKVKDLQEAEKPLVFYEVWNEPLMSAGKDTFINDLIEKAGGVNVLALDDISGWAEYSIEALVDNNPEIIIAPISLASDPSIITGDARFASIDAVKNNKIYIVPDNPVSRTSQNMIKGLEMFARAIHPEIFGEFEIIE
ncbi:MAG: ABC transporter substrate-binding protein [Actinobacteria bacterium]|nr:ABC transporter substrate-binding protein [Actinomycetota bacterium]